MNTQVIEVTKKCRLCGSEHLELSLTLPETPLANDFRPITTENTTYDKFPLEVLQCTECSHVQLRHVVDPRTLFSNYAYVSGTSKSFVNHFERYATWLITELELEPGSKILEIGCNDATLLKFLSERGLRCIGIDPAANIIEGVQAPNAELICSFFDSTSSQQILDSFGKVDLIVANNVFAHIWNVREAFALATRLLNEGGFLVFEVSYLLDVIEKCLFDTIYHEHLDYHSISALKPFLESLDLVLVDAVRVDTHGGSIRVVAKRARRTSKQEKVNDRVIELLNTESEAGITSRRAIKSFARNVQETAEQGHRYFSDLKESGARIAGFGAPAKMTTLVYTLDIIRDIFDFIVDDSALKQNTLAPGGHTQIFSPDHLYMSQPDYVAILAWNFATVIAERHPSFSSRFVVPVPSPFRM